MSVRVLTNFLNAPDTIELPSGVRAEVVRAEAWPEVRRLIPGCDLIVIDCRDFLIYKVAAHFTLFPWKRRPLAAVDLVLRRPVSLRHKLTARLKKVLLSRVDHFVHYFNDISGYTAHFGVPAARSSYVPFKSNIWGSALPAGSSEDYIFTLGVSLRDYDTFIRAVAELPYPAAIPEYSFLHFEGRDARFPWTRDNLPPNLTLLSDTGKREDLIANMAAARLVVIPVQASSLCASGISTCLDAMYLGKCVVLTDVPGGSDVLTDQALLVPPQDPGALRDAIRRAWEDHELRHRTAAAGRAYALSLGGEQELLDRILQRCIPVLMGKSPLPRHYDGP